ncbi:hypothetical protein [Rhodococcus pyridinivorans]|uniref:hypothetical protein n=1 Tax=Rhodococcus pyridinivorans TaxID=103816 RepID=UPI00349EDCF4
MKARRVVQELVAGSAMGDGLKVCERLLCDRQPYGANELSIDRMGGLSSCLRGAKLIGYQDVPDLCDAIRDRTSAPDLNESSVAVERPNLIPVIADDTVRDLVDRNGETPVGSSGVLDADVDECHDGREFVRGIAAAGFEELHDAAGDVEGVKCRNAHPGTISAARAVRLSRYEF